MQLYCGGAVFDEEEHQDVFSIGSGVESETRRQDKEEYRDVLSIGSGVESEMRMQDKEEYRDVFTGDESDMRRRCIRHWYW